MTRNFKGKEMVVRKVERIIYYLSSYRYQCVKLVIQTFISFITVVHEAYVVNGILGIKFCNAND